MPSWDNFCILAVLSTGESCDSPIFNGDVIQGVADKLGINHAILKEA